jgi:hypothetical protein
MKNDKEKFKKLMKFWLGRRSLFGLKVRKLVVFFCQEPDPISILASLP